MDAVEFMRQMSSQAKSDIEVPKTKLGFIDYDFNPATYPQVLPKVTIDGQGLSLKGYVCLNTYDPRPGDRVIMLPHSDSFVILGAIEKRNQTESYELYPGQFVFHANNHNSGQVLGESDADLRWTDSLLDDAYGFWDPAEVAKISPSIPGTYRVEMNIIFPTNISGNREARITINENNQRGCILAAADMNGNEVCIPFSRHFYFNGTTDYLKVVVGTSVDSGSGSDTFPTGGLASTIQFYYAGFPMNKDEAQIL